MRWCILPAHTHSQIRLDLHESNAKIRGFRAIPCALLRARTRWAAVELVFSPRNKHKNNSDRNQRKQKIISQNGRRVAPREFKTAGMRVPFQYTTHRLKQRSCPGHERATPRAHSLLNTRARVRACARVHTHNTQVPTYTSLHLKHT